MKKRLLSAVVVMLYGMGTEAYSQGSGITDDTIFVHRDVPVELRFPSNNSLPRWIPPDGPFTADPTNMGFVIHAKAPATAPAVLLVTEGPGQTLRRHKFIVVYKDGLTASRENTLKDWSTKQKLQDHIDKLSTRPRQQNTADTAAAANELPPATDIAAYNALIREGDEAFEQKQYAKALDFYTRATNEKSDETYPNYKIIQITILQQNAQKVKQSNADSLANVSKVNQQYQQLLQTAAAQLARNNLSAAKLTYTKALELKPFAQEPREKLEQIIKRQSGMEKSERYDSAIARANMAIGEKQYQKAYDLYRQALRLKPSDTYALKQVQWIKGLIAKDVNDQLEAQRQSEYPMLQEMYRRRFEEGMKAYSNYERAAQLANFDEQLLYLKQFLNHIPNNSLFKDEPWKGDPTGFAKEKIQAIRGYLARIKGSQYQVEAVPFLNDELESKYPYINFSVPPDKQLFDTVPGKSVQQREIPLRVLLDEKPRLQLQDTTGQLKVTCTDMIRKDGEVCLKFTLQNNGPTEFVTGSLLLKQVKANKKTINRPPSYVSSFPIVLPGKSFVIVYYAKDFEIDKGDILEFEIGDRLKDNRMKLNMAAEHLTAAVDKSK